MTDPQKKITFGFSKIAKKTNLLIPPQSAKEKPDDVQFIDCLEGKSIKLREGEEEKEKGPIVIPIIGPRKSSTLTNGKTIAEIVEGTDDACEVPKAEPTPVLTVGPADSLESMAAREILQEASDTMKDAEPQTLETLPTAEDREALQKESTIEDYENIPVTQFGLAMLRGMGWKEDEGIGKNKKLVAMSNPIVRPKGMGLGADKVPRQSTASGSGATKQEEEELKLVKGACVKVWAGSYRDQYAQVEGFNDDSGRVILKLAIGGQVVSVNEASVHPVTKSEYSKNSKVLNATKFDEFKKKEGEGKPNEGTLSSRQTSIDSKGRQASPGRKHRSSSVSPGRRAKSSPDRRKQQSSSNRKHKKRDNSYSPSPDRRKKLSPDRRNRKRDSSSVSPDRRKKSVSPQRRQRSVSVSPKRSSHSRRRSRSRSRSRSKGSRRDKDRRKGKPVSRSSSRSPSPKKDKKKKKKDRRTNRSSSDSEDSSRSRSITPKRKRKGKKSRRSRSRSPSSRKWR